uniref:Translocase of outer mitochondrial membrane 6 n=1 Tax=Saimiri boliviensis boliviensis TaxID=39432 RepID=A0A2K6T9R2_SAIBB
MASSQVPVSTAGSANETPEIPDNVGDWLRGVYRFATVRNDFWRNSILNLGLFVVGAWLARNLSDIDLMAPQSSSWVLESHLRRLLPTSLASYLTVPASQCRS